MLPWSDRAGRLSPLKAVVFAGLFVPGLSIAFAYGTGGLGPRPLTEAIDQAGLWALRFLFVSLAVTPLRQILDWPHLVLVRRMLGVAAFAYALTHLVAYAADQMFDLRKVAAEIALRFYLTIGLVALLSLSALAATSTDDMIRRLGGRRWRHLHRLAYGVGAVALIHYFLQTKAAVSEPLFMAGCFGWLMAYRLVARLGQGEARPPLWSIGLLALLAAAGTAGGEAIYFWLKLGVDPPQLLAANLGFSTGMRPGAAVLLAGAAVLAAGALRVALMGARNSRLARARGVKL